MDNDGDGSIDEDVRPDMNADNKAGLSGVDDDGDGAIDEENQLDDDEDGLKDEDWYDSVVFYLSANRLMERMPVPWDTNGDSEVSGADFIESVIAENVTRFRVERMAVDASGPQLVDITLELTHPQNGEFISLHTMVRLGGAL
jgi:hypothetical protein